MVSSAPTHSDSERRTPEKSFYPTLETLAYPAGVAQQALEVDIVAEEREASLAAVREAFDEVGIPVTLTPRMPRLVEFSEFWDIVLGVPLAAFLGAFAMRLGKNLANDVDTAMKHFVSSVFESRRRVATTSTGNRSPVAR